MVTSKPGAAKLGAMKLAAVSPAPTPDPRGVTVQTGGGSSPRVTIETGSTHG